jgi:dCTP deaminase
MSVLVRAEIEDRIARGDLGFTPQLDELQMQAHSVDLRLGFTFLIPRQWQLTERGRVALTFDHLEGGDQRFDVVELEPGQYFEVLVGEGVIASTLERITLPNDLVGHLYPRSSVNRRGLAVDLSGIVDAGYQGNLIIPVHNNSLSRVVRIYPGERFCQLTFTRLSAPTTPRPSRYQNKDIIVGVLPEHDAAEVELIRAGRLEELKRRFGIEKPRTDADGLE